MYFHFHTDEFQFDKELSSRQCKFIKTISEDVKTYV